MKLPEKSPKTTSSSKGEKNSDGTNRPAMGTTDTVARKVEASSPPISEEEESLPEETGFRLLWEATAIHFNCPAAICNISFWRLGTIEALIASESSCPPSGSSKRVLILHCPGLF